MKSRDLFASASRWTTFGDWLRGVEKLYAKAGAKVYELDEPTVTKWQTLAREAAWKDYGARNENCAKLLAAAEKLL